MRNRREEILAMIEYARRRGANLSVLANLYTLLNLRNEMSEEDFRKALKLLKEAIDSAPMGNSLIKAKRILMKYQEMELVV